MFMDCLGLSLVKKKLSMLGIMFASGLFQVLQISYILGITGWCSSLCMGIVWLFLLTITSILLAVGGAFSWLINFLTDSWGQWLQLELLIKALDKDKPCLHSIYLRWVGLILMEPTNVKGSFIGAARATQITYLKSNEDSQFQCSWSRYERLLEPGEVPDL